MQQNYYVSACSAIIQIQKINMKGLKLFFLGLLFLSACNTNNAPENIIEEQKMVRILADLHVMDGYMASLMYSDSIRVLGNSYYKTVYKKYSTTKPLFEQSMKYYSMQPVLLDSMYSQVEDILKKKEAKLFKLQEKK